MMDPTILAFLTVLSTAMLNAAVNRAGEISAEKGFEALSDFISNAMRKKPEFRKAAEQVSKQPNDPVARAELERQVVQLLDENPEQARLLSEYKYIRLSDYVGPMKQVEFDDIRRELVPLRDRSSTTDERLHIAASLYAIAEDVQELDYTEFSSIRHVETAAARGMKAAAVIAMKAYTAFVLMRDKGIEEALTKLPDDHLLKPFKDFFGSDTVQHLRNAIGVGSFATNKDFTYLVFFDGDMIAYASTLEFLNLCKLIKQFYAELYSIITGIK